MRNFMLIPNIVTYLCQISRGPSPSQPQADIQATARGGASGGVASAPSGEGLRTKVSGQRGAIHLIAWQAWNRADRADTGAPGWPRGGINTSATLAHEGVKKRISFFPKNNFRQLKNIVKHMLLGMGVSMDVAYGWIW